MIKDMKKISTNWIKALKIASRDAEGTKKVSPSLSLFIDDFTPNQNGNLYLECYLYYDSEAWNPPSNLGPGVIQIKPTYLTTPLQLERILLSTLTRTNYSGTLQLDRGRYIFDFSKLSTTAARKLLDSIVNSDNPRTNFSWVEPLQNLIISRKKEARVSKKKSKWDQLAPAGIRYNPPKSKRPSSPSAVGIKPGSIFASKSLKELYNDLKEVEDIKTYDETLTVKEDISIENPKPNIRVQFAGEADGYWFQANSTTRPYKITDSELLSLKKLPD